MRGEEKLEWGRVMYLKYAWLAAVVSDMLDEMDDKSRWIADMVLEQS